MSKEEKFDHETSLPDQKEDSLFTTKNKSCKCSAEKVPIVVNLIVNFLIMSALSLSIYLLIANIFLTINKISMQTSLLSRSIITDASSNSFQSNLNYVDDFKANKYYDCSKSILSNDECELLNSYHNEYLNALRSYLLKQSTGYQAAVSANSLKVNTSFFIH